MISPPPDARFDRLMTEYRAACPELEPSPRFLSQLWRRIDARRNLERAARRWASAYLTAAAVLCLILVILISMRAGDTLSQVYLDVLDDSQDSSAIVEAQREEERP